MSDLDSNIFVPEPVEKNWPELFYRRHPINLLVPALITLLILLFIIGFWGVVYNFASPMPNAYWPYLTLFTGWAVFMAVSYFMMEWMFWYFDTWVIKDDKLIDSQLVAFFRHNRSEMPLRQAQDIKFDVSGVLATLFDVGDVTIQTASKQALFTLRSIAHPERAVKEIGVLVQHAAREIYGRTNEFIYSPSPILLGELLVQKGLITAMDLAIALEEQKKSGLRLGKILINKGLIKKQDLLNALSAQHRIPEMDLTYVNIDPGVVNCLTKEIVLKYRLMPLFKTPNNVLMIAVDNLSAQLTEEVQDACGTPITFVIADEDKIQQAIREYYGD